MSWFKVVDANGKEIEFEGKVLAGDYEGVVVNITEPDGDVDDNTGREFEVPPRLTVRYSHEEGDWEYFYTSFTGGGEPYEWDAEGFPTKHEPVVYSCDDLEVK